MRGKLSAKSRLRTDREGWLKLRSCGTTLASSFPGRESTARHRSPADDEIEDGPFEEPTSTAQAKDQEKGQGNGRGKDEGKRRSYGSSAGIQPSTDTIVDYFREKYKESQALETQKLALERERLELARTEAADRREAEKEEREARRIAEREERESRRRKEDDRMERRAMLDILCRLADKLK